MSLLEKLQSALSDRYLIDKEIGAGGMATVYLARDLRHDREVALKLLKPELGAVLGPERFLSEIRVTAKLQHPNLLPLFDSGETDGQLWYVMPYVEGESLRARMDRERQLSVREAVRIATLVAGALDYAHRHGVIHRDLKPENILLHEDQPLVADFGIALAVSNAGGERVTQTGLSLGTPQYMSPEQATGERGVDARTDIYSLGAVLYEMLVGEPPHTGATVQAIIARLMTDTPRSIRATRSTVPENVDWAVQKALEKVPADRFETAKEFAETLQGNKPITGSRQTESVLDPRGLIPGRRGSDIERHKLPWILAGVAGAFAIVAAIGWARARGSASDDPTPITFTIDPSTGQTLTGQFAISPDGHRVVYGGEDAKGARLYSRTLDDAATHEIPGTESGEMPFFSADGKWIAFFAGGNLVRVPPEGGSPIIVARNLAPRESDWTKANGILIPTMALTRQRSGMSQVPSSGGVPKVVLVSDTLHRENMRNPFALPDGDHFLFTSLGPGGIEDDNLAIGSLSSKDYKAFDFVSYSPVGYIDGYALVTQFDGTQSTMSAVPINVRDRKITGDPVTLRSLGSQTGAALSTNGTLVYASGAAGSQLMWLDGTGKADTVLGEVRGYATPRVSPDGKMIALYLPGGTIGDVWIYNVADRTLSKLSTVAANYPEWTPDGKRIVFVRSTTASAGIYMQSADGSSDAERVDIKLPPRVFAIWAGMSPDGTTMLMTAGTGSQRRNIYYFKPGTDEAPKPWLTTSFDESAPRFSPDGKWVVYVSDESGASEVYVRPFPGPGGRVQVSSGGGQEPMWSHDGKRIFYRSGQRLMAADITMGAPPTVTARRQVLSVSAAPSNNTTNYDISADGKRILLGKPAGGDSRLVVVVNWFSEVRQKLREAGR